MSLHNDKKLLFSVSFFVFTGCATIMSAKKQAVSIDSNPPGAVVSLGDQTLGTTPFTIVMERHSKQEVVLNKTGFEPFILPLNTNLNSWFWGNWVSWNIPGWIVDAITGSMTEYSPNHYLVNLQPKGASSSSQSRESVVVDDNKKVENFVLKNNVEIRQDISKGNGTYLSTLLTLLKIDAEKRPTTINEIKQLADKTEDPSLFTKKIIEKYFK